MKMSHSALAGPEDYESPKKDSLHSQFMTPKQLIQLFSDRLQ